jgi:peptidoglycan/xylan/chitin deacetylase (PgdA/CDA1 family)
MKAKKKSKKKNRTEAKQSLLVGVIVFILVALCGSFLFWQHSTSASQKDLPTSISEPTKTIEAQKPEPPKVEKYKVPILMYHYIRIADPADTMGISLSVTPTNFDSQMNWLKQNDYESMKLEDLADPQKTVLSQIVAANKKPIIITFDDGYDDAYTQAMPTLQKYGFTGTFFIIRNFVGRAEYATKSQISEMAAAGMEIGSHTLDHKDLAAIPIAEAQKQIFNSKMNATVFCYPSGERNDAVVALVKSAGYVAAVTTVDGIANQDSDLFQLPRVRIKNVTLDTFAKRVQGLL